MRIILSFLMISVLIMSACKSDSENAIVQHVKENGPLSFNEENVCELIPRDVIQKHMDYTVDQYFTETLNMQQYSMWGAGCSLNWNGPPNMKIDKKKVGSFLHAGNTGHISLQILSNYNKEKFEDWAMNMLLRAKELDLGDEVIMTEEMYYVDINNVGTQAIWNNAFSILKWRIADELVLSMQLNYPMENDKRLSMAKEIAQHINQNLLDKAD